MALDLERTAHQLDTMMSGLKDFSSVQTDRLGESLNLLEGFVQEVFLGKLDTSSGLFQWTPPIFPESPAKSIKEPSIPVDYSVVGVDGSHIDVNRHIPVDCFLINTGSAYLRYGAASEAHLSSSPKLFVPPDETVISDPNNPHQLLQIQGTILGAIRAVKEMETLAMYLKNEELANSEPVPIVGLVDGTLLLLDLLRPGIPDFVIDSVLTEGFLWALNDRKKTAEKSEIVVASYISLPGSYEIIDGVRMLACPYTKSDCLYHCGDIKKGTRPCDSASEGLLDRDIMSSLLEEGGRSELFKSNFHVARNYYGDNEITFFYLNTGYEIARVEMPAWASEKRGKIDLVHAVVMEQCRKGRGYPTALMEAHEQAVISTSDRQYFLNLVEEVLERNGIEFTTSQKDRSKRLRWL